MSARGRHAQENCIVRPSSFPERLSVLEPGTLVEANLHERACAAVGRVRLDLLHESEVSTQPRQRVDDPAQQQQPGKNDAHTAVAREACEHRRASPVRRRCARANAARYTAIQRKKLLYRAIQHTHPVPPLLYSYAALYSNTALYSSAA